MTDTLEPRPGAPDLVVSAADLLAGRASPDEAIVLLDRLLTGGHGAVPADSDPADCLLWHAPSAVVQLWPDTWVARSAAVSRVLGPTRRQAPLTFVHPSDRGVAMRAYVEAMTGRRARRPVLLRVRAADGGLRLFETTFLASNTAVGRPSVVVYGQDLTGWHADRVRLRELMPRIDHGAMVVDVTGRVLLRNDALTRMFGPRAGRCADQHDVLRWLVASCRDVSEADQQVAALTAATEHSATRLHLADGRTVHVDRTPVTDADLAFGAVWRFWDVPAPHRPDVSGGQALAGVSHELNAIARLAGTLSDRRTRPTREDWRAAAGAIARGTRAALAVVDDLLLMSRLDGATISLRYGEVRIPELVRNSVVALAGQAKAAGVVLGCRTGQGPALAADGDRLRQVLDRLVRDAVKRSAKGGTVTVSARHKESRWMIAVEWNAGEKGSQDKGLGLAIARRLVEFHGGCLTVDGDTAVCVTIPVRGRTG